MQYYVIEAEVSVVWGKNIVVDRSVTPMRIVHLHLNFVGWLGDELLRSHPVHICTERVADALRSSALTGCEFAELEVGRDKQFRQMSPKLKLPPFRWLQVKGNAEHDDFGLREQTLVVSERALACLRGFPLKEARVWPVSGYEWNPEKRTEQMFAVAKAWADEMARKRGLI
jgi:hypothetical protein